MVNMIGFHHREPAYNTAAPGEPGFYVRELPRPTPDLPDRSLMSTPCTRLVINDPDHARRIIAKDNPGAFPILAREYLEKRGVLI